MGKRGSISLVVGAAVAAFVIVAVFAGGPALRGVGTGAEVAQAAVPVVAAAPSGTPTPEPSSIAVVRREAGRDAIWSVVPSGGAALKLSDLAFRPGRTELSPDGGKLAMLPLVAGPRLYVYDFASGELKALSLAGRGVRQIDALTWRSDQRLIVSGSRTAATKYATDDRLYSIDVETGRSAWFRQLYGTEPSVAGKAPRLVYVRLRDAGPDTSGAGVRLISEKLVSLRLAGGTKPHVVASDRYTDGLDLRSFKDPRISPDGRRVISSTTQSDVGATYTVRTVGTGARLVTKSTQLLGRDATAWDAQSARVAFGGVVGSDPPAGRVFVYDVATDKITAGARYGSRAVSGLSWAPDGAGLAFTLRAFSDPSDRGRLWVADPASLAAAEVLGAGSMPAWLP